MRRECVPKICSDKPGQVTRRARWSKISERARHHRARNARCPEVRVECFPCVCLERDLHPIERAWRRAFPRHVDAARHDSSQGAARRENDDNPNLGEDELDESPPQAGRHVDDGQGDGRACARNALQMRHRRDTPSRPPGQKSEAAQKGALSTELHLGRPLTSSQCAPAARSTLPRPPSQKNTRGG